MSDVTSVAGFNCHSDRPRAHPGRCSRTLAIADDDVTGTDWSSAELDAIVADYFAMLRAEQTGHRANKTARRYVLMKTVHRSNGSMEFKHQNICAVLTQLGLPRIAEYRPAWNFQGAIADAIGRFLAVNPDPVPFAAAAKIGLAEPPAFFIEPPPRPPPMSPAAKKAFDRVVRKFDPALRDALNRALGLAGAEHIYEAEQRKQFDAGPRRFVYIASTTFRRARGSSLCRRRWRHCWPSNP